MKAITSLIISGLAAAFIACGPGSGTVGQAHTGTHTATVNHATPVRLEIPKLGIDTSIEPVATDKNGNMGVPADYRDVAWYAPGVIPGDAGDAVISGHLDWVVNGKLTPAVFTNLGSLKTGDKLEIVGQDGRTLDFSVNDSRLLAYNASPAKASLFASGGPARVTLITCAGTFDQRLHQYTQRLVVTAQLVAS
jgi:LPXTG-site transpeptidase (sortase) family protein